MLTVGDGFREGFGRTVGTAVGLLTIIIPIGAAALAMNYKKIMGDRAGRIPRQEEEPKRWEEAKQKEDWDRTVEKAHRQRWEEEAEHGPTHR